MIPTRVELSDVPPAVRDHSRLDPLWEVSLTPVAAGLDVPFPDAVRQVFRRVQAHVHARGDGIRNVRFTRRATGSVFRPARSDLDLTFRDAAGSPVALGAEMVVDGFAVYVNVPQPDGAPGAEERADWLRWLLRHDPALPAGISRFARDTLAEATQVVWARQALGGADHRGLSDDDLASELKDAAFLLGRLRREADAQAPDAAAAEDAGDDEDSFIDDEWLDSPEVMSSVRRALDEVREPARSAGWISWWRRRYTLTAANALLGALGRLTHGLDSDALILDLDPDDETLAWITETGPGGIGAVEACLRAALESPQLLSYALASALMPTDVETMDAEMVAVISLGRQGARPAAAGVIAAWRQGHEAARQALEQFYAALSEAGVTTHGASRTAISTRLLGPGAHPDLMDSVAHWLAVRERLARAGVHTNSRVLAAVVGSGPVDEDVLRLPPGASPQRRARAIANVLWPWGSDAAPQSADNPYADLPSTSPGTLGAHADLAPPVITISQWSADLRAAVHDALVQSGEVRLRFDGPDRAARRAALLDLQTDAGGTGHLAGVPDRGRDDDSGPEPRGLAPTEGSSDMNRVIRKAQAHSSGEAFSLLAALMATELLQPSKCLWLISPWISDLILLDNSAGTYDALRRWGTRPVRLAEILATLLSSSAAVVIATTPDPNNRRFVDRLLSLAKDARHDDRLSVFEDESDMLHAKSIVADDFALVGSMNLTYTGVHLREEYLELKIDPEFVAEARISAFESFGGIL